MALEFDLKKELKTIFGFSSFKGEQEEIINSWMIEKIDETYININKDNKDCNFTNKWVKK